MMSQQENMKEIQAKLMKINDRQRHKSGENIAIFISVFLPFLAMGLCVVWGALIFEIKFWLIVRPQHQCDYGVSDVFHVSTVVNRKETRQFWNQELSIFYILGETWMLRNDYFHVFLKTIVVFLPQKHLIGSMTNGFSLWKVIKWNNEFLIVFGQNWKTRINP